MRAIATACASSIELKRGEQAEVILNNLYKNTQLQISFGIINLSIVNGQPRELSLISTIKYFIEHRVDVVRRRTDYELRKAREREHILLGFRLALDNIDEVIRLIRASKSPKEARESLVAASTQFVFNDALSESRRRRRAADASCRERQAQAIIELQLQRLTGMEQEKIANELAEIQRRIARVSGNSGLGKSSARSDHQRAARKSRKISATSAARRSSTTRATSVSKIWSPWKTWPSRSPMAGT